MTPLQWITMNPETKEGLVVAPPVPLAEAGYRQTLEWAALRHLMLEVKESGGGDMNLNAIYIKACEQYCNKWGGGEVEAQPAETQPPRETPT